MALYSANPFGIPGDPKNLPSYGTPVTAISSVLYNNLETIFTYKTFSEPDVLDECLKKWASRQGNKVFLHELDIRRGAGLAPLGFSKDSSDVIGVITGGYALPYFAESFQDAKLTGKGKYLFSVPSLNYDEKIGGIVSDYITPLETALSMNFSVVTPTSIDEVQAVTLLSLFLAKFNGSRGVVNLYEGSYAKTVTEIKEDFTADKSLIELSQSLSPNSTFEDVLDKFNEVTNLKLHNFQYTGAADAETVFVVYGSLESQIFHDALKDNDSKAALIAVRIPLPFDLERFVTQIPSSAKKIVVVGQTLDGRSTTYLKAQVSAALFYHRRKHVTLSEYMYQPNFIWSPAAVEQIISAFIPNFVSTHKKSDSQSFVYWSSDKSPIIDLSSRITHSLSLTDGQTTTLRTKFDNTSNAGTFQAQFTTGSRSDGRAVSNIDNADVSLIENIALLDVLNIPATVDNGGTILLISRKSLQGLDLLKGETYVKNLGINAAFFTQAAKKNIKLVIIDAETIGDREETKGRTLSFVTQSVFWKYAFGYDIAESVRRIWSSAGPDIELLAAVLSDVITTAFQDGVKEVPVEAVKNIIETSPVESDSDKDIPIYINETSFTWNQSVIEEYDEASIEAPTDVARKLVFKEAYGVEKQLRPDLPVKNFIVKVKENRRVTPADYDRYIFHIEFDITGTGLKYDIGEALGVHARNNDFLVKEFLELYGLNENQVVLVPNKDNSNLLESRTLLQAFVENLDIFGKPPKKFYESLIQFATDEDEKKKLEDLVSPAGSVDLKRYQDVEYYTYADIFKKFPSARPSAELLVTLIAPLKRREYSIASSQKIHENEIHLLIVVVDWIDNKGRKRFGQASKYLSELSVGSELVVSVKPSVMKLPPNPEQPVIMSGLGTGLAPFKAIVEEKLWQKQQGYDIGEVYLYLGSRHKREEYLYGELWEAYKDAGIITHIGAAFSRDQPEKIYIQDRIKETLPQLKKAMIDKVGSFYLCGPTWPVPDITQALQDILLADATEKGTKIDLNAAIEDLKETSRYILEVY